MDKKWVLSKIVIHIHFETFFSNFPIEVTPDLQ